MSGITLSASVRQNLLSLQSTADLLATTQNALATGNKVNSALDNPTSYFTAQSLNNRASDINNLLDQIGNGVQVLQAANTGITSLQSLVSSAQSIANQVLQAPTGYTTKSSVSSGAIAGGTAQDLLGGSNVTVAGSVVKNQLATPAAITSATLLVGAAGTDSLAVAAEPADGSTITVDGKTITFSTATTAASTTDATTGNITIGIGTGSTASVQTVLSAIDSITGASTASTVSAGALQLSTGTTQNLVIGGTAATLTDLGLSAGTTADSTLAGKTLTISPTITSGAGATSATSITFGTGAGQVSTLNALNTALAANDLQASSDSTGVLSITTTNNASSSTVGTLSGSAVGTVGTAGAIFATGTAGVGPVADPNSQATRNSLVAQYNQVIQNITTTAQDSSFNGINLLNGDTLNLTFDETGASKLSISGVTFDAIGLGLSSLTAGTDFLDSNSANNVLTTLTQASTTLRTEASSLGSNLSVVQIRQDFNKNLINVLQTGASNLTLADTNEEAADSQALSTRQSIAVSALALANTSQQSVLQLLR